MDNDIIWEMPPQEALDAQAVHRSQYGDLALALRQRKGEWARVPRVFGSKDSAKNTAQNMRRGQVKGFIKGEYKAITHETTIWVRYVGPKEPAPTNTERSTPVDPGDDHSADPDQAKAFPARVRAWAKLNGRDVSAHGRLPEALIAAYEQDTQDFRPGGGGRSSLSIVN